MALLSGCPATQMTVIRGAATARVAMAGVAMAGFAVDPAVTTSAGSSGLALRKRFGVGSLLSHSLQ